MGKRTKEHKKDYEKWLLMFEELVGKPVVVSLLIEKQKIGFLTCWNKSLYERLSENDDEGDESPEIDLEKAKKEIKSLHLDHKTYIG